MFTGIIEVLGTVSKISKIHESESTNPKKMDIILSIIFNKNYIKDLKIGDSLSINGTCLTITKIQNNKVFFELVKETVDKTCLKKLKAGDKVNVEKSMQISERFDGHMVLGHVDCVGIIEKIVPIENETKMWIKFPRKFNKYVVEKGSITLDGVSLTVVNVTGEKFSVALIPHTLSHTNLGIKLANEQVNIEFDIIGKYIFKYLPKKLLQQIK